MTDKPDAIGIEKDGTFMNPAEAAKGFDKVFEAAGTPIFMVFKKDDEIGVWLSEEPNENTFSILTGVIEGYGRAIMARLEDEERKQQAPNEIKEN